MSLRKIEEAQTPDINNDLGNSEKQEKSKKKEKGREKKNPQLPALEWKQVMWYAIFNQFMIQVSHDRGQVDTIVDTFDMFFLLAL